MGGSGTNTDPGARAFSWNGENRLVAVEPLSPSTGDNKVEFTYDYMGRRVQKSERTWQSGNFWSAANVTYFSYDANGNVTEVLDESDGSLDAEYGPGTLRGHGCEDAAEARRAPFGELEGGRLGRFPGGAIRPGTFREHGYDDRQRT